MRPAGQREVDLAKADGRWDAAYEGQRSVEVPEDLQAAFDADPQAAAFFATLDSANRYAVLYRVHEAKRAETRARRIEKLVAMLHAHETIHPQRTARKAPLRAARPLTPASPQRRARAGARDLPSPTSRAPRGGKVPVGRTSGTAA